MSDSKRRKIDRKRRRILFSNFEVILKASFVILAVPLLSSFSKGKMLQKEDGSTKFAVWK